ncbi:hypothetical protein J537_1068 [Acinetobacter baumannii 1437282]|nr:hypothetical protein J537_1068 [Acinetobacter baumannii 1437282]
MLYEILVAALFLVTQQQNFGTKINMNDNCYQSPINNDYYLFG